MILLEVGFAYDLRLLQSCQGNKESINARFLLHTCIPCTDFDRANESGLGKPFQRDFL